MSSEEMKRKLGFVVMNEGEWRIKVDDSEGECHVIYDAHGRDVRQANREIRNLIAAIRGDARLSVIHGFNHGTAIKQMVTSFNFGWRVTNVSSPSWNPGMTDLILKPAV